MSDAVRQRRYRTKSLHVRAPREANPFGWKIGAVLMAFLVGGLYFVWLTSKTEALEKSLKDTKKKYEINAKEMENVRMELENKRKADYIFTEVEKRSINLHQPTPGQVRRLSRPARASRPEFSDEELAPVLQPDVAQRAPVRSDVAYP